MKHWLSIFLLCSGAAFSQTQGSAPNVKDGALDRIIGGCGAGCINWPEPLIAGETVVLCNDTSTAGGPFAMSDTSGNSWSCTNPTQTPAPATNGYANMCWSTITVPGPSTLQYAFPAGNGITSGGRFFNLGALDGPVAVATFAGNGGGGNGSIFTSKTTIVNNDSIISCGTSSGANTGSWMMADSLVENTSYQCCQALLTIFRAGSIGPKTPTYLTWNGPPAFGANTTFAMQSLAFKPNFATLSPTTIAVTDTKIPDAGSGVPYEADMHCAGGIAPQSFILTGSLPLGLNFNTTTGKITGSTTSVGTVSLGFQCTDGTTTSAMNTLPLTVGSSLGTPAVRHFVNTFDGNTGTVAGTVCGDMLHAPFRGTDTHSDLGWIQTVNGASNKIFDSFGSPVQRMLAPFAGPPQAPINDYAIGPLTSSGPDTVAGANNQAANSGLPISGIYDLSGVQSVSDQGSQASAMMSNGNLSVSYTTTNPNTMLLAVATTIQSGGIGGGTNITVNAPWVVDSNGGDTFGYSIYAHTLVATPSTVTATFTTSSFPFVAPWGALIIPVRAGLPVPACITTAVRQEVQEY